MSMTNYPISNTSTPSKSTSEGSTLSSGQILRSHDCRARDIKRRLEVIQKKMTDLQELGVPCGFCYISARNTGTLFTMGNSAITQVIEQSRDLILQQLSKVQSGITHQEYMREEKEIHMLLPPLPAPLDELSLHDLRGLVVGIVKDLGLKWSDPKPLFWPEEVPFQYPRTAPEGFQGCWTKALRKVIQSIYSYYNYNPNTHCWKNTISTACTSPLPAKLPAIDLPNIPTNITNIISSGETPVITTKLQPPQDDEDEEVDVGTPEEENFPPNQGVNYAQIELLREQAMREVMPPTHTDDVDTESTDTISVCSDPDAEQEESEDRHIVSNPVSYFGYEIALSESSHSSPRPSHTSENDEALETSVPILPVTSEAGGIQSLLQPHLLYYDPRLYPHLYPMSTAPLLLQHNLLMNKFYSLSSSSSSDKEEPSTKIEPVSKDKDNGCDKSSSTTSQPLSFSFSLPKHNTTSHPHITTSSKRPTPYQLPNRFDFKHTQFGSLSHSDKEHQKMQPLSEAKSRKSRNGIYIYTTPTAPLKFMSLNSRKYPNKSRGKSPMGVAGDSRQTKSTKSLIAGAPVSPHTGEPVVMKDSGYHLHVVRQVPAGTTNSSTNTTTTAMTDVETPPTIPHSPRPETPPSTSTSALRGPRKPQGSMKKRRELVFHWYQSPEAPILKRPKMVDSV